MQRCRVDGCERHVNMRLGFCGMHYQRFKRHGDPLGGRAPNGDAVKFINMAISFSGDDCLIWPYATGGGYGRIGNDLVHRLVCETVYGPPSCETPFALHSCNNGAKGCVNPRHLRWGTQKDNMDDMINNLHRNIIPHMAARLSVDDVRTIRTMDLDHKTIAKLFGVTPDTIYQIRTGRRWRWLDAPAVK